MKRFLALLLLVLAIPTAFVLTQETQTATLEITGINATGLPEVVITSNIVDGAGKPIPNVSADDLELTGELAEFVTIERFENVTREDLPFATVLVIDTSSSMAGDPIEKAQDAAKLFINSIGANDLVAVMTFNSRARLVQDYTSDKATLIKAVSNLGYGGQTALYEATVEGIELASKAPVNRRTVIILSDGAEYGNVSAYDQATALSRAQARGVTVYTIGLGTNVDERYLQRLAQESYGESYSSPTPDELAGIYKELADQFRSQYVLTLGANVPADGSEYDFTLVANTGIGKTNAVDGTVRAPIPVPILSVPSGIFDAPLSTVTTVSPIIRADDFIDSLVAQIDGQDVTLRGGAVIIDPTKLTPGTHELTFKAVDSDGDEGTITAPFEVAVLPSTITLSLQPNNPVIEAPVKISVTGQGQTPLASVTYVIQSGDSTIEAPITDSTNNFAFTFDPITLPPGEATITATALNEGGGETTQTLAILIAPVEPKVSLGETSIGTVNGAFEVPLSIESQTPVTAIGVTVGAKTFSVATESDVVTIDPQALGLSAGSYTAEITVTDSNEKAQTVSVPFVFAPPPTATPTFTPTFTPTAIVTAEATSETTAEANTIGEATSEATAEGTSEAVNQADSQATAEATSDASSAEVTAESTPALTSEEITATAQAEATLDAQATQTAQAQATLDAQATQTAQAQATLDAQATQTAQAQATQTAQAQATLDAQATSTQLANAQSTRDARTTQVALNAQATQTAQIINSTATSEARSTQVALNAQATSDAQATLTALPTSTPTLEPTATSTNTPEATATLTNTPPPPTFTPVGTVQEAGQAQPPAPATNILPYVLCAGAFILLVGILYLMTRAKQPA